MAGSGGAGSPRSRGFFIAFALVAALTVGGVALAASLADGRIGPDLQLMPNGRHLQPAGDLVTLGNFPTGAAVTPDGRFYWTVSTGRGFNDIRIVSVADATVVQTIPIPGGSGGIAFGPDPSDPSKSVAYVSGVADSNDKSQEQPTLPGRGGDVIHVFHYDPATGIAQAEGQNDPIPVPAPQGSPIPQGVLYVPGEPGAAQEFPPTNRNVVAWPDRLAVSPDGKTLLVPLNLVDKAAIVDVASRSVRYVDAGHYPYAAAILPDGKTGLVSNEASGTVSVIDLQNASKTKDIQVGANLSHPEGIALDPKAERAYVAIANSDQVAVVDTSSMTVERVLSTELPAGDGSSPVDVAVTPGGNRLLVAEADADNVAVFSIPGFDLIGRIPTSARPQDVSVAQIPCATGTCLKVLWMTGEGFGVGPNDGSGGTKSGPNPFKTNGDNTQQSSYLPNIVDGQAGILDYPTRSELSAMTRTANTQIVPSNAEKPPAGTPLGPKSPIKHVFYIVRENRTYDQVLGDDSRGDGDAGLELFGPDVTPNIHALVKRFPLVDHVYANSQASIDGHFWTSAAKVSDYVNKAWYQNYAGRNRPYDFGVFAVTWPQNGFLFDQAERQGISYFNYGEAIAGVVPFPDKDRSASDWAEILRKDAHSDLGEMPNGQGGVEQVGGLAGCYPNDASIESDAITGPAGVHTWDSTPPASASRSDESRYECFNQRFTHQLATGRVPAFNYLVLPNDHTVGTSPGKRTPFAMIADNDYGLGEIVDRISHSPIWKSSAIFVVEDDSQDGADHVDAHRIPAAVISPFAKQGAIVHTRYDFLSVIRSMELILGMKPLGLWDKLATPMYDAFQSTPSNDAPYDAIVPNQPRDQLNTTNTPAAAQSARLDFRTLDQVPQQELDQILWQYVHGAGSQPPPPGPNAVIGG